MSIRNLLLALTLVLPATPASRAANVADRGPLNAHTPSWLTLGASARFRAEGLQGVGFEEDDSRGYVLQRYRFSTDIAPADWVHFFGEVQDSREAGSPRPGANFKDSIDLRQAWVGLGGRESDIWDLKVGRQSIAFGSERIIGAGEWGNVPRVFDAARLGLHHGSNRVDIFSSSVVHGDIGPWDDHRVAGDNLHGIYGSLGSLLPKSKIEPYLLRRTSPSFGSLGALHSWTSGLRAVDSGSTPWGYETEVSVQRGRIGQADLSSWAGMVQGQRRWANRPWKPVAVLEYDFASGDRTPNDGVINTFDQLYPTNHGKYGVVDQVGRRNTKDAMAGLWFSPHRALKLKAEGHSFWLANRFDALYGAGGGAVVAPISGGASTTDVGREIDISADWKPTQHYEIGFQYGRLIPGKFLKRYSPGFDRSFYTVFLTVGI